MNYLKKISIIFVLVVGLLVGIKSNIQAMSNETCDQYLKELTDSRSFTKRAALLAGKEIVKFGGTALLFRLCNKINKAEFGPKLGLRGDNPIIVAIALLLLVGTLTICWPTISEMYFISKDKSNIALKELNQYLSNLDSNQKIQLEAIKKSMLKEFAVTTLIDAVVLPLLFYFGFFKADNDDSQIEPSLILGLESAIAAAFIKYRSLEKEL